MPQLHQRLQLHVFMSLALPPHLFRLNLSAVLATLLALQPQAVGVCTEAIRVDEAIHAQADAAPLVAAEMIARLRHTLLVAFAGDVGEQLLRIGQCYLMLQLAHYQRRLPRPVVFAVHQCYLSVVQLCMLGLLFKTSMCFLLILILILNLDFNVFCQMFDVFCLPNV